MMIHFQLSLFQLLKLFWHASTLAWLKVIAYGVIPIGLAIFGAHYAAETMHRKTAKRNVRILFIVSGALCVGMISYIETKDENEHLMEVSTLNAKVTAVQVQDNSILQHLITAPSDAPTKEFTRREEILTILRHEWVLSHTSVSPGLLTGTEDPPEDWVNTRLKELGEKWAVQNKQEGKSEHPQPTIIQSPSLGNLAARAEELGNAIMAMAEQRKKVQPNSLTNRDAWNDWYRNNDGLYFRAPYWPLLINLRHDLSANNFKDPRLDELIEEQERYFEDRQGHVERENEFPTIYHSPIEHITEIGVRLKMLAAQIQH